MKKLSVIFVIFAALFFTSLYANDFSESENALIYRTLDARLKTRLCKNEDEAISQMKAFRDSLEKENVFAKVSDEVSLILINMINLEIYNYMYQKDMNSSELKPFIITQYDKITDFQNKNKSDTLSAWFYLSSGDVMNSSMQFLSQSAAIKIGLQEKSDYDLITEKNPEFSFAKINRGLWYYFAPAIGGGSKKIAKEDFLAAVKYATSDYERFYSRVYLSQLYYDDGMKNDCTILLDECDRILPENSYIPFIRFLNENEYSLLYYTNNREKVEKKLIKER